MCVHLSGKTYDNGVPEKYIRLAKDMYGQSETVVRRVAGTRTPSTKDPLAALFAIVMDSLTRNVRKEAHWQITFANVVVL